MRASRAGALAIACIVAGALVSYAVARRLISARAQIQVSLVYSQKTFSTSRIIKNPGFTLETTQFRSRGGPVEADWYDSALASIGDVAGSYVTLYIDGHPVESSLRGELRAFDDVSPATLTWEGWLTPGVYRIQARLDRVDTGFAAPFVQAGYPGTDSLTVTQYADVR